VTVFELLADHPQGLRVAEVAEALAVHKATASRLLATLAARRMIDRVPGGGYRLGPGLIRLAGIALSGLSVVSSARPELEALVERVGETVNLAVLDMGEVLYVDQVTARHAIVTSNWVGRRSPAHCSSSGKVLLAFGSDAVRERALGKQLERRTPRTVTDPDELRTVLADVRRRGFASAVAELEEGLHTVAAPVVVRGRAVAAVSVSGPSFRLPARELPRLGRVAMDVGRAIARRIGDEPLVDTVAVRATRR